MEHFLSHYATTWMNPANTVLSERSQTQKATYCMIPFIEISRIDKPTETKDILMVAMG